MEVTEVVVRTQ